MKPIDNSQSKTHVIDMSKTIRDYLPENSQDHTLVQGRVPTHIFQQVKTIMKAKNLSWADVMTACLRQFLDEMPNGPGVKKVK